MASRSAVDFAGFQCVAFGGLCQPEYPPPGGATVGGLCPRGLADRLSRLAAAHLAHELKRPVAVKNVSGANGVRAGLEALQSGEGAPVLLFADSSLIVAHQLGTAHAPDLQTFMPVGTMGFTPFAIAVAAASPWQTLPELVNHIRQNPASSNYGSPGVYSVHQLAAEMLLQNAQAKAQHIPYQGGAPMLSDLLQHRLTFGVVSIQLAQQYLRQQQLRVLAVTGPSRSPPMPDAPAVAEFFPKITAVSTAYLLAAPGMERGLYSKLVTAWRRAMTSAELSQRLQDMGMEGGMRHDIDAGLLIRQETEHWRQALRQTPVD